MRKRLFLLGLAALASSPAFADGTIDTLTPGGALTGTESIPMFQGSNPAVRTTPAAFGTYISSLSLTFTNKTINCANNTCTVRLGSDVTGNLPVTNLAGGSGATSTTFWRGDGTWAVPPTGSGGGVNSGTAPQAAYYGATGAVVSGNPNITFQTGYLGVDYNTAAVTALPAAPSGTILRAVGTDGTQARIAADAFGTGVASHFVGECARGTGGAPTAIQSGDTCSNFVSSMYNGANYFVGGASFIVQATETQAAGHGGALAKITTTPTGSVTPGNVIQFENDGGVTVPPTVTGGDKGAGTINATGLFVNGVAVGSGGGATTYYSGVLAGGPTAYTVASTTPSGFVNATNAMVCTNTGALSASGAGATLNVGGTSAFAINQQSIAGVVAAAVGAIQPSQSVCFLEVSATGPWVLVTPSVGTIYQDVNRTISAGDFVAGSMLDEAVAGITYTLPNRSTTTIANTGAVISIVTHQFSAVLQAAGTDVINSGAPEASTAGGSIVIPPNIVAVLTAGPSSGAGAWRVTLGGIETYSLTWAEGLNLSAAPRYVARSPQAGNILNMTCNVQTAAGATSRIHLWATPSGTSPGSGTQLDTGTTTGGCDANTASLTEQSIAIGTAAIPANSTIWAIFSGTGTSGNGGLTISYR